MFQDVCGFDSRFRLQAGEAGAGGGDQVEKFAERVFAPGEDAGEVVGGGGVRGVGGEDRERSVRIVRWGVSVASDARWWGSGERIRG